MKFEDMVDIMCNEFDKYSEGQYLEDITFDDAFRVILRRMLAEGMLPPFVLDGEEDHTELSSMQYVEKNLCYWEKEDV